MNASQIVTAPVVTTGPDAQRLTPPADSAIHGVIVSEGVVHLWGFAGTADERAAAGFPSEL